MLKIIHWFKIIKH